MRWFPEAVFTHAVQLDTIGNTYCGAATNGISGRFQSVHRGIIDVSFCFDGFNFFIVCLATLVEVWSVTIFSHGPSTPLLMRDDHAPLIRSTGTSVAIAVHNFGHRALPVVAGHLDEISFKRCVHFPIKDICQGH